MPPTGQEQLHLHSPQDVCVLGGAQRRVLVQRQSEARPSALGPLSAMFLI